MGNGQSTVEDRASARIAKPKGLPTGRSSGGSSPVSKHDDPSPMPIGIPYSQYNDSESVVGSPTKREVEMDQEFRQHIRSQLLSSEERGSKHESGGEKVDVLAVSLARSLSRSGSRRTNAPTPKTSVNKLKNNTSTSQLSLSSERTVDLETAVALLHELRKTATPEDLVALHRALLPTRSNDPLSPTGDGFEDKVGTSVAGLIRRKSLARPGVATRHARKEPKPEVRESEWGASFANGQVWKPEMMGTSPLARLSSLDNLEPDLLPPPTIAENRAHTPTGDEYSNLGSLKRGSLMVTNGAASPAPSFISRDFTGRRQSEDEYFTASEHGSVPTSPTKALPALPSPTSSHQPANYGSYSFKDQEPRTSDQYERSAALSAKRSGSPLKREIRAESPIWESDRETDSLMTRRPRAQPSALSLVAKSENHSLFSNMSSEEDLRARNPHQRTVSQSAISLAAEYMLEMPPSPHTAATKALRASRAEPSPNSSLSRLDIAYGDSSTPSPIEQSQSWETREIPSFGQTQVGDEILAHTALRSHPPNIMMPLKSALKTKRSSQAKTDSGYCSSVSTGVDGGHILETEQPNLSTVESVAVASPTVIEPEEVSPSPAPSRPQTGISETWPTAYKMEAQKMEEKPAEQDRPEGERSKSWKKSARRSLSRLRSAESTPSKGSIASTTETTSPLRPSKSKKLQKRRPLSQPPLTIGGSHNLDGEVPRVPSSVFSRFSERLATSPGLQHLDRTYEDALAADSRRGSASPRPASGVSPVVSASYFPDADQGSLKSTANRASRHGKPETAGPKPPPHRHGFSRLNFRRSSTSKNEGEEFPSEEITGVADFGTVAQSLGSDPYDIAKGNQPQRPRSAVSGNVQYPHQLGSDQRHYGPREGWDAETASRFAQTRSRERAAASAAAEREPLPGQTPPISARPRSYHEQSPLQYPTRPSMYQRPKSVHGSVPQAQGHPQQQFSMYDENFTQHEYPRPSPSTSNSASMTQPKAEHIQPVSYDHAPRSASPVKNMVSVFEARAALAPTPSPRPPQSPSVDWSEQSRMWRERKLNAQTSVRTTSSDYEESVTTTTTATITAYVTNMPSQPNYPTMQTSYTSTPTTTTRTIYSSPPSTTTQTSYVSTPTTRAQSSHSSAATTTTQTRISQTPTYSQISAPTNPKSREQLHSASRVPQRSRHSTSPTPEPSPIPAQQQAPNLRVGSGGIFGRYGGGYTGENVGINKPTGSGKRRDITPRTQAIRAGYGVDFGDIPVRNAPI